MVDEVDIRIPSSQLQAEVSPEDLFNDSEVEWIEAVSSARVELSGPGPAPRDVEDLEAKIDEIAEELRALGDGTIPAEEELPDEDVHRYERLQAELEFYHDLKESHTEALASTADLFSVGSTAPSLVDIGITMAENVSAGVIAAYLYERLSAHGVEQIKLGDSLIQPITRDKLRTHIERLRETTRNE